MKFSFLVRSASKEALKPLPQKRSAKKRLLPPTLLIYVREPTIDFPSRWNSAMSISTRVSPRKQKVTASQANKELLALMNIEEEEKKRFDIILNLNFSGSLHLSENKKPSCTRRSSAKGLISVSLLGKRKLMPWWPKSNWQCWCFCPFHSCSAPSFMWPMQCRHITPRMLMSNTELKFIIC